MEHVRTRVERESKFWLSSQNAITECPLINAYYFVQNEDVAKSASTQNSAIKKI